MSVTMTDVAAAAGVNKATVSRALKGDARISQATRERIWAIARELGYLPNANASTLSSHHSPLIAVITDRLDAPGTASLLAAAARVLARNKKEILLIPIEADTPTVNVLRRVRTHTPDGLIVIGSRDINSNVLGLPTVRVSSSSCYEGEYCVCLDGARADGVVPFKQLGLLAARLLINVVRGVGVRPRCVLVRAGNGAGVS